MGRAERQPRAATVAVFNAGAASAEEPPIVFFPGGRGYSSLGNQAYLEQLLKYVGNRTLVTMDHRGSPTLNRRCGARGMPKSRPYHDIIHTPAITSSPHSLQRIEPVAEQGEACYDKLVSEGVDPPGTISTAFARCRRNPPAPGL